jgi:hypothetical protein
VKARTALTLAIALLAFPAKASDGSAGRDEMTEKRLRGCLAAGAATAPKTSLAAALQSIRAFCGAQIAGLSEFRVAEAMQGLTGEAADEARKRAIRALNDEIAHAVANFTGLTE